MSVRSFEVEPSPREARSRISARIRPTKPSATRRDYAVIGGSVAHK
jgi:hypothetical protein